MSLVLFLLTPILLVIALAVRFAGNARVLNIFDYAHIADPLALHAWAGNRLLILPFCCAGLGTMSLTNPSWSWVCGAVGIGLIPVIVIWVAAGTVKFQRLPGSRSS